MEEGYWGARVDVEAPEGWERGPVFRLRGISLQDGRGEVEAFAPRRFIGAEASRANLEALQERARRHYLDTGFPFAELLAEATPDASGLPFVDVTFRARRGGAYKLALPRVSETRTRPETVLRLALWEEGEDFDQSRIERGLQRLRRSGYFDSAEWTGMFRDPARNVLYPQLRLPDARVNTVGGLLGYDTEAADGASSLTGFLDVRLVNILGTARDLSFTFDNRTGYEREVQAAYVEPWILGLPVGARAEFGFLQQDTLFWEWNQDLVFFRDLNFNSRVEASFGAQGNNDALAGLGTRAWRSGVRLLFDGRDRAPFTRAGYRADAGLTGLRRELEDTGEAGAAGAGDSTYYLVQAVVAGEVWRPLGARAGMRLGLRAATNWPLDRLNRGEIHYVGGTRSLRGYREREFQTNAYALGDAELYLWAGRRGRLFAFASPGLVNQLTGAYDPRGVLGYGSGIELSQGDWSMLLSYALNPDRTFGDGLLHIAVENRF